MVGIFVIAHQPLASALASSAMHVFSRDPRCGQWHMKPLDVAPDAEPDEVERRARDELAALDDGHGVLVLTDCLGGTPANVASRLAEPGRIEVVAGVNLPMLLRAMSYCDAAVDVLAEKAAAGGARGITAVARTPVSYRAGGSTGDDQTRIQDQQ